jgi:protein-S-isoprenylcysteine O-methyltransferase Ste14
VRATLWEFKNRALLFGLIFALGFSAYAVDPQNSAAALSNWLAARAGIDADAIARSLFGLAAVILVAFALIRTWASAYLHASVVYASQIKTDSLVADGPYRYVRNPLYFGNLLLVLGLAALMSRVGAAIAIAAMVIFCYRLILREESELEANRGEPYRRYRSAVARLWPALRPRVPSAGGRPDWVKGFQAEFWAWGYVIATAVFAATLSVKAFFIILAASIGGLWLASAALAKKARDARTPNP